MIPKIIHFCWFGGKPKPEIIEKCIASWKVFCPDWQIMEWNDSNYNLGSTTYAREACSVNNWVFAVDVARLEIIYEHGGVYMDTDVELLGPIEDLLDNGAFFFFESERFINPGMGFGAEKGHKSVAALLEFYEKKHFIVNGKPEIKPSPATNTGVLREIYPRIYFDGNTQKIDDVKFISCGKYIGLAKHYGTATWTDTPNLDGKYTHIYKDSKLKRFLKQPKSFGFVEKHFGEKGVRLFTFLVYDLAEFGPVYYLKRLYKKTRGKGK